MKKEEKDVSYTLAKISIFFAFFEINLTKSTTLNSSSFRIYQ
jgi:hypothetical protein